MKTLWDRISFILAGLLVDGQWSRSDVEQAKTDLARWQEKRVRKAFQSWSERTCAHCGKHVVEDGHIRVIDYMLKDEVWFACGFQKTDVACIGCAQERLGRLLTPDDFTNALCNMMLVWGLAQASGRSLPERYPYEKK